MSEPVSPRSRPPVYAVDRRHRILERVAAEQTIHVAELAVELGVSEMTIRRDIRRLGRDGFVRPTYGGATAHITRSFDVAFNARALEHPRAKRLIGMRATQELAGAHTAFIGIGTTAEQLARYLHPQEGLTVVTASIPTASLLGTRPLRVVLVGGDVLRDELTCVGPVAVATLERYHFDVAVVGAAGLTARWGITELNEGEAEVQRRALARADRVVVIADGSKIGTATSAVVAPASRIDRLITDESAASAELEALSAVGIEMVIARRADGQETRVASPRTSTRAGAGRRTTRHQAPVTPGRTRRMSR